MSHRSRKRAVQYIAAGRPVADHRGAELVPATVAIDARRKRVAAALALKVTDQSGIGFR